MENEAKLLLKLIELFNRVEKIEAGKEGETNVKK